MFQEVINCKIAKAVSGALDNGATTRRRIVKDLAPSIVAASKRSVGMVFTCWRRKKIANPLAKNGTITAQGAFSHPSLDTVI